LHEAAALVPEEPPSPARAVVLDGLAIALGRAGEMAAARAVAEQALIAARAAGAVQQETSASATLGVMLAYSGELEPAQLAFATARELALEVSDYTIVLRAYANLSDALELVGRHEEAAETAAEGLVLARQEGLMTSLGAYLIANRAESLLHLGRWEEVERVLASELEGETAELNGSFLEMRARLAMLQGRYDDALAGVGAARRVLGGTTEPQYTHALSLIEATVARDRGDLAGAREIVRAELATDPASWLTRYVWPLVSFGLRVETEAAARGAGSPERTEALAAITEDLAADTPQARAHRALAAAELGRGSWSEAVAAWREAGEPYPLASALLRAAAAAVDGGDREGAAAAVAEADAIARGLGAAPLVEELAALVRRARLAARPEDGFALTEREREVLALIAEGRSNSQIAHALFISPKTASVHVSNILAKLGVSGRGEAAAVAHRRGLV
jgi:DNA-binding CsgD family transcriptional regulator